MNIKDSNKHFEKLSSFYTQVSNDGEINKIELELLKSYVLNFYESITTGTTSSIAQPVKQPSVAKEVAAQPAPTIEAEAPAAPVVEAVEPVAAKIVTAVEEEANISPEINNLFSLETGNEISDKLSMSPIKDVAKAMNINERIFTIKELFGGNQETFTTTMSKLNGFSNYEEATKYLSEEIVEGNGWLDPSKAKKVKTFMKLVARKYI